MIKMLKSSEKPYEKSSTGIVPILVPIISILLYQTISFSINDPVNKPFTTKNGISIKA
jgi:hypothetical protein